jgi:hypothetical protein
MEMNFNHFNNFVATLNKDYAILSQEAKDKLTGLVNAAMMDAFERGRVQGKKEGQ